MLCLVDSELKRPSTFGRAPGSKQMLAYCPSLENCVIDWVALEIKLRGPLVLDGRNWIRIFWRSLWHSWNSERVLNCLTAFTEKGRLTLRRVWKPCRSHFAASPGSLSNYRQCLRLPGQWTRGCASTARVYAKGRYKLHKLERLWSRTPILGTLGSWYARVDCTGVGGTFIFTAVTTCLEWESILNA